MNRPDRNTASPEIQANRLRVLNRLVGDLAHEVKNPLNAVVINLELLKRRVVDGHGEDALEHIARVEKEIHRVHDAVDALFELMRPDREPEPPAGVEAMIEPVLRVFRLQAKAARVTFDYRPARADTRVDLRPNALQQVLLNIFADALDAVQPKRGRVELGVTRVGPSVELRITDTGGRRPFADPGALEIARRILRDAGASLGVGTHAADAGAELREVRIHLPYAGPGADRPAGIRAAAETTQGAG